MRVVVAEAAWVVQEPFSTGVGVWLGWSGWMSEAPTVVCLRRMMMHRRRVLDSRSQPTAPYGQSKGFDVFAGNLVSGT